MPARQTATETQKMRWRKCERGLIFSLPLRDVAEEADDATTEEGEEAADAEAEEEEDVEVEVEEEAAIAEASDPWLRPMRDLVGASRLISIVHTQANEPHSHNASLGSLNAAASFRSSVSRNGVRSLSVSQPRT